MNKDNKTREDRALKLAQWIEDWEATHSTNQGLGLGPERDPDLQFKVGAAPPSSHAQEGLIRAAFYRELPLHQWAGTPETEEEES